LKLGLLVVLLTLGMLMPCVAQTNELPCQAGSRDMLSPTYDPLTFSLRSWLCVDPFGTVTSPVFPILSSLVSYTSVSPTQRIGSAIHGTAAMDAHGTAVTNTSVFSTTVAPSNGPPKRAFSTQVRSAAANTFAGSTNTTTGEFLLVAHNNLYAEAALGQLVTERSWIGYFDTTLTTAAIFGADSITSNGYAAFRFSTTVPDTNWQAITSNGTSATVTNTGIAADTATHRFFIKTNDGTSVQFYIDGTLVATNTTNLPSSATRVAYAVEGIASTAAVNSDLFITALVYQTDY
jgi:hypothetical protein